MTKPKAKTKPPSDGQLIADAITRVFECVPPAGSGLNVANGLYAIAGALQSIAAVIDAAAVETAEAPAPVELAPPTAAPAEMVTQNGGAVVNP